MGWKALCKKGGGGIATFAASGIGYGMTGSQETSRRQGYGLKFMSLRSSIILRY